VGGRRLRQQIEGGGAEVAKAAVGGGERGIGCAGDGEQGSGEQRASGVELARVGFGKGGSGKIEGEEAGVGGSGEVDAGDGLRYGGALFEAAALVGQRLQQRGEISEEGHSGCRS